MRFWRQFTYMATTLFDRNKAIVKPSSIFLSTLIFVFFSQTAMSGAWVPKVGSGYSKLAISSYSADDAFGNDMTSVDFSGQNLSYYGEYGFANNFVVYGTLLYQKLEQVDSAGDKANSFGFGDTEIGVRYQWKAQPFVLSTSFLVKLPYLYSKNDALPRGNAQEDYEFRVLLGRSLNQYGYLGLEGGYRLRSGSPSDEYRYLLEYGFSVTEKFYLRTKLDGSISAKNSDQVYSGGNLSMSSEFDLTKIEFSAGWVLGNAKASSKWGLEATYRRDLAGENSLKGNGVEFALTKVF